MAIDLNSTNKKNVISLQQKILKISNQMMVEKISISYVALREKIKILRKQKFTLIEQDVYRKMVLKCGVSDQQIEAATQFLSLSNEIFYCEKDKTFVCIDR